MEIEEESKDEKEFKAFLTKAGISIMLFSLVPIILFYLIFRIEITNFVKL